MSLQYFNTETEKRGHEKIFRLAVHKIINFLIMRNEIFVRKELHNA
jgi:hypothetical protein